MNIFVREDILLRSSRPETEMAIWCLPGFADSGLAFSSFFDTELTTSVQIIVPDLPGFGSTPIKDHPCTIMAYVDTLLELIEFFTADTQIGLIGHSAGSIIAVEAALKLGDCCQGVFSIEGNLTEEDAYFSGQAADFDDAHLFKKKFSKIIWEKGEKDKIFRSYFTRLNHADPKAMWLFGRDVKKYSKGNLPGKRALEMRCPFLYVWCLDNTPIASQEFLLANKLNNIQIVGTSHWPMIDAAELTKQHLSGFFNLLAKS